jgi:hypothetical protein
LRLPHTSERLRLLVLAKTQLAEVLTIIIIISATPFMLPQEQSSVQGQQEEFPPSNRTAFNIENPIEDLSFEIDNSTFSHHTASVMEMVL